MDPAFISAFAALAGAIVGGLTSFATTWFTQRAQFQSAEQKARRAKLESLYNEYMSEVARRYVHALTQQSEDPANMVPLYALAGRMRLNSAPAVTEVALRIEQTILETYLSENRSLSQLRDLARDSPIKSLLIEFSEACRNDLAGRT